MAETDNSKNKDLTDIINEAKELYKSSDANPGTKTFLYGIGVGGLTLLTSRLLKNQNKSLGFFPTMTGYLLSGTLMAGGAARYVGSWVWRKVYPPEIKRYVAVAMILTTGLVIKNWNTAGPYIGDKLTRTTSYISGTFEEYASGKNKIHDLEIERKRLQDQINAQQVKSQEPKQGVRQDLNVPNNNSKEGPAPVSQPVSGISGGSLGDLNNLNRTGSGSSSQTPQPIPDNRSSALRSLEQYLPGTGIKWVYAANLDDSTVTLNIFADGSLKQAYSVQCTSGANPGPKSKSGDDATPVGVSRMTRSDAPGNANTIDLDRKVLLDEWEGILFGASNAPRYRNAFVSKSDITHGGIICPTEDVLKMESQAGNSYENALMVVTSSRSPIRVTGLK